MKICNCFLGINYCSFSIIHYAGVLLHCQSTGRDAIAFARLVGIHRAFFMSFTKPMFGTEGTTMSNYSSDRLKYERRPSNSSLHHAHLSLGPIDLPKSVDQYIDSRYRQSNLNVQCHLLYSSLPPPKRQVCGPLPSAEERRSS